MGNPNHPKKGSTIRVQPITRIEDIHAIKKHLEADPRNLALFTLGINTNLRASDLIRITAGQVRHLKPMDELVLKEKKTGKVRRINLNKACVDAIQGLLASRAINDKEPLFYLTVPSINRLVKQWCRECNVQISNAGAHTMRKSFGYHQRVTFGTDIAVLMSGFNHATQKQTLTYLCVQPEELKAMYANQV